MFGTTVHAFAAATVITAVVCTSLALISPAAAQSEAQSAPITVPSYSDIAHDVDSYAAGTYLVTLTDAPAATYRGGVSGYSSTAPRENDQLDASSPRVRRYSAFAAARQARLASAVGAKTLYSFTAVYNGFVARLTSVQAARLAKSTDVASVIADERVSVSTDSPPPDFSDQLVEARAQVGGDANAGSGIVVADIDTGIAAGNPSFAGAALQTSPSSTRPWLNGSTITFSKADGGTFTSEEIPSTASGQWSASDYSEKVVGAQYFVAGFGAAKIGSPAIGEYLSPRDGNGHGSHTASTAAGNSDVMAGVGAASPIAISGVAPAAKLAIYKACWSDANPATTTGDSCYISDLLAAINQAVTDGVDVINFSVGGNATTSFGIIDAAFLNATAAGVFVAAAAGNDGAGASTVENVAPWETTVAATTSGMPPPATPSAATSPAATSPAATTAAEVADFSGRGPSLASGSDILKPDIAAPGVSILAAVASAAGATPKFARYSGTSMATPQIAGLAAVYLQAHPLASPAEIKSALMTTAATTADASGAASTDAFAQGAGLAQPASFLTPGLVYPATVDDYKSYLLATGDYERYTDYGIDVTPLDFSSTTPKDASDLNEASISIGDLAADRTVTRTVTSTTDGAVSYRPVYDLAGFDVTVTPSTLDFTARGQSLSYTVTFTNTGAAVDAWTTGSLSWVSTAENPIVVRSAIAVHATSVHAPAEIAGTGTTGSTAVTVTPGFEGSLPVSVVAAAASRLVPDPDDPSLPFTGIARASDAVAGSFPYGFVTEVAAGTALARFSVYPTRTSAATDLDLEVFFVPAGGSITSGPFTAVGSSATSSSTETVTLDHPAAGSYLTYVDPYSTPTTGVPFRLESALARADSADLGKFSTSPVAAHPGLPATFAVDWKSLTPRTSSIAVIGYGPYSASTVLTVAPSLTNWGAPTLSAARAGEAVTVAPGDWSSGQLTFHYTWTVNGQPLGETGATVLVPAESAGSRLEVTVTASTPAGETASAYAIALVTPGAAPAPVPEPSVPAAPSPTAPSPTAPSLNTPSPAVESEPQSTPVVVTPAAVAPVSVPPVAAPTPASTSAGAEPVTELALSRRPTTVTFTSTASKLTVRSRATVKIRVKATTGSATGTVIIHYGSKKKTVAVHASAHGRVSVAFPRLKAGRYRVWVEYRGSATFDKSRSSSKKLIVHAR